MADNSESIEAIFKKYGASNPRLFGSVAHGDVHPGSDIDLLVNIDDTKGCNLHEVYWNLRILAAASKS